MVACLDLNHWRDVLTKRRISAKVCKTNWLTMFACNMAGKAAKNAGARMIAATETGVPVA